MERRCVLTSLTPPKGPGPGGDPARDGALAGPVAGLARNHRKVENSLHWRLDVLMGEDACCARKGEAAVNLAAVRRLTLNVLKAHPSFLPGKKGAAISLRSRQYVASISPNYLRSLIESVPLTAQLRLRDDSNQEDTRDAREPEVLTQT